MPGVSRTLTFAKIHFNTIKTLRLDFCQIPSFDPTVQFFGGEISRLLVNLVSQFSISRLKLSLHNELLATKYRIHSWNRNRLSGDVYVVSIALVSLV